MRKTLFLITTILLVALLIGCKKEDIYDTMTEAPDIDEMEGEAEENPLEEIVEGRMSIIKSQEDLNFKEGCFYEKEFSTFYKAGITFYILTFSDFEGNIAAFNLTSRSRTTIDRYIEDNVGICFYQDKYEYFYRNGSLYLTKRRII